MRVWHIPYEYLDNIRLLAQHREIHMLLTCVKRNREWGPTRIIKTAMPYASEVHERYLSEVLVRKGVVLDKTPFKLDELPEICFSGVFHPTEELLRTDVLHLRQKWVREGYFHGVGRSDLRVLEDFYGIPIGDSPELAKIIQSETKTFIKLNKTAFALMRSEKPKSRMQDRVWFLRASVVELADTQV